MNANSIFTRKSAGLDKRVWMVMFASIVLPLGLLGYRLIDTDECKPIEFTIKALSANNGQVYQAGETLIFKATSANTNISWDFGDNSEKAFGPYVIHKFKKEGEYYISASTGGACDKVMLVSIKQTPPPPSSANPTDFVTGEEIVGSLNTIAGKEELFTCMVTAESYEWAILNYPKMTRKGPTASFTFPLKGKYTVQVTLDHDRTKRYSKEVMVEDAEVEEIPKPVYPQQQIVPLIPRELKPLPGKTEPVITEPVKAPETNTKKILIADAVFLSFLEKVQNKEMGVNDFDQYLCGGGGTKVVVNGDIKDLKTLSALCQELSGSKKISLQSVALLRNDGCVTLIQVKWKKKSKVLGIF